MLTISNNYQSIDEITNRSNNYIDWANVVDYNNENGVVIWVPLVFLLISCTALFIFFIKSGLILEFMHKKEKITAIIMVALLLFVFVGGSHALLVTTPNEAANEREALKAIKNNISLKYDLNELKEFKEGIPLNDEELSYTGINYNKEKNEAINLTININKVTGEPIILTTELVDKQYVKSLERNKE